MAKAGWARAAKDGKLRRDVAIKVLPEEFAENAERLARFKREAKVLASLNHPNVASIYGLEQWERTHYLVLELVPGENLPLDLALAISTAHPTRQGGKLRPVKRAFLAVALLAAPVTSVREVMFEGAFAESFVATDVSDLEK